MPNDINPLSNTLNDPQPTITTQPIPDIPKKKRTLPANFRKKHGQLSQKTKKALQLVTTTGIEPKEALTLLNNGKIPNSQTIVNFKRNLDKYRLSNPRMVKLARNVVLDTLKGECREVERETVSKNGEIVKYTDTLSPTITNQLAAASMVYDRADPVIHQAVNINLNADVDPIDLERWRNG